MAAIGRIFMPLSNAERQRRWRKRHPELHSKQVCETQKRHQDYYNSYRREQYHRIQDEAGCHMKPRDFLPGFRILKALETAEVVEI